MSVSHKSLSEAEAVRSYAIRRVNPFLGVLQVIETRAGRSVSANGVVWDIEVRADRGDGWGTLNRNQHKPAYYRYGLWSLADGLVNRPLAPHLDNDPLTQQCNELIDCTRAHLEQLPLPLVDNHELWLFDRENMQPLALLASATADSVRPSPEPKYWTASIGADGVPSQRRYPCASELEAQVKQRAGFNIHKHWITRLSDGGGIFEVNHAYIAADRFPAFLLIEDWPDVNQIKLATEYVNWVSPSLLTLQYLSHEDRSRLEHSLSVQARSVEHHWQLYPEIIDEQSIKAARVQCRLQNSD